MIDPRTVTRLTFPAHLHVPTGRGPAVSFYINRKLFSALLETVFETRVYCLPGVGLTEINSFLVSPPLVTLPLAFVTGEWWKQVYSGPWGHILQHPCAW